MLRRPMLRRWSDFRQRQREILRASNAPTLTAPTPATPTPVAKHGGATPVGGPETGEQTLRDLLTDTLPLGPHEPPSRRRDYGTAGRPLNRQSPFYVGFVGAIGVLVAYGLFRALGQLTQVITLLLVAFFLTLALNPLVEALNRRGLRRSLSVTIVFAGLVAVFTALGFVVVPPVAQQGGLLADNAPRYLDNLLSNQIIQDFDSHYHVLDKFQGRVREAGHQRQLHEWSLRRSARRWQGVGLRVPRVPDGSGADALLPLLSA